MAEYLRLAKSNGLLTVYFDIIWCIMGYLKIWFAEITYETTKNCVAQFILTTKLISGLIEI